MAKSSEKTAEKAPQEGEKGFRLSYKFRLFPTPEQAEFFDLNFRATRFVYNHFLTARIKAYEATKPTLHDGSPNPDYDPAAKPLTYYNTSKALTALKKEVLDWDGNPWLRDADSVALVYALRHLDDAYQNFFRRVKQGGAPGYPKFKSSGDPHQSYTTHKCEIIDGRHVFLPKVGVVEAKVHRNLEGEFVNATVSRNAAGQYHVSVNVKEAEFDPLPESDAAVGVSLGVRRWVVTSEGVVYDYPDRIEKLERKLAREQRWLARKVFLSNNYQKQRVKVARVYLRIANVRSYSMHALTRDLVNGNGVIVSREMRVTEMMQGVKGKAKLPRKAKERINHAIASSAFGEINRQLAYKSQWAGRVFVLVPSDAPTTQVCAKCGYRNVVLAGDLRDTWICPECQTVHDRKHNSAKNVLEAGLDILHESEQSHITAETAKGRKAREAKRAENDGADGNVSGELA